MIKNKAIAILLLLFLISGMALSALRNSLGIIFILIGVAGYLIFNRKE
jgi:hypothetical protein